MRCSLGGYFVEAFDSLVITSQVLDEMRCSLDGYFVEAFETDTTRGPPRAGRLSGVIQVVLFVAGIAVQYKVFPPDGMREAREREQARRRQSRYVELNDN
mmetsp:Transcript_8993/g.28447  ORF Transcript_8993/g.28447 Transcript_8993/m.28447 type:complete len:100 (+) Transcript_8993:46-345(+)